MPDNPVEALRNALYRARATMAEGSRKCSEWGGAEHHTGALMGFQQIDRLMQDGVEDTDRALIEHEQTNIFHLWLCRVCGDYELPYGDLRELADDTAHVCHDQPMEKVQVERIS